MKVLIVFYSSWKQENVWVNPYCPCKNILLKIWLILFIYEFYSIVIKASVMIVGLKRFELLGVRVCLVEL
jgi:hypothetical protein